VVKAPSLRTGDWILNLRGDPGTLRIAEVDKRGGVSGYLMIHREMAAYPIRGRWEERTKKIVFHTFGPIDASTSIVFSGYMINDKFRMPGLAAVEPVCTLVGTFVAFSKSGGQAKRHEFGWYGQLVSG
jgi:hypothetical protein